MAGSPCYLDACVYYGLVQYLRHQGVSVTAARDEGLLEADDETQLHYAAERGYLLLTHNGKHFRRLHERFRLRGEPHGGIIVLPAGPPHRLLIRTAMVLSWIGTLPSPASQLFRWGYLQQRLEQGYRLPGYSEEDVRFALGR